MVHMMAPSNLPPRPESLPDMTPQQIQFLESLLAGGQVGVNPWENAPFDPGSPVGNLFGADPANLQGKIPLPKVPSEDLGEWGAETVDTDGDTIPDMSDPDPNDPLNPAEPELILEEDPVQPIGDPVQPIEDFQLPIDTDGDGIPDKDDWDPFDPNVQTPPGEQPIIPPIDSDGDGIPDMYDFDPMDPDVQTPPGEQPITSPVDTDGDGIPDVDDFDPWDPNVQTPPGEQPIIPWIDTDNPWGGWTGGTGGTGTGTGGTGTGTGGTGTGTGGTGTGGTGVTGGVTGIGAGGFAPVFNIGNPAQDAVDATMDAYDQYQAALLEKYKWDTIRDIAMGQGGAGGGGDLVGPVGLFNRVTQGGGRYQQPSRVAKKPRSTSPKPNPQNPPVGLLPDIIDPIVSDEIVPQEAGGFDAAQFVGEVQADVAGKRPVTPPREDEWKDKDTEEFLEEIQGTGPIVTPGLQPGKLSPSKRALAALPMGRLAAPPLPDEPMRPFPPVARGETPPAAKESALESQFGSIMKGAGAPLAGQLGRAITQQGQEEEFQNLATAAQRGQDIAQATYGLKGQERSLADAQKQFQQSKVQQLIAGGLLDKRRS